MENLNDLMQKKQDIGDEIATIRDRMRPFLIQGDVRKVNELKKEERRLRRKLELIEIEIRKFH